MFRFTIREMLWLTAVAAMGVGRGSIRQDVGQASDKAGTVNRQRVLQEFVTRHADE